MKTLQTALTILIADDDTEAREALATILTRKYPQAVIYSAGDGRAALDYFRKYQPDIVITDVIMPGMDGVNMAREIRAMKVATKLIMFTGLSDLADFDAAAMAEIRIDHSILKPIDFRDLFAAIDQCIAAIDTAPA
jgi:YesN/AraC family two-component response regulator